MMRSTAMRISSLIGVRANKFLRSTLPLASK
jgi:hypothetical protein